MQRLEKMITRFDPPPTPAKDFSKAKVRPRDHERIRLELVQLTVAEGEALKHSLSV